MAVLGYRFEQKPWDVINAIILVNVLTLQFQLYFYLKDGDPLFGKPIQVLRGHNDIAQTLSDFLSSVAAVMQRKDPFIQLQTINFLNQARGAGEKLRQGVLEIDLRPGGSFFREVDVINQAKMKFRATSCVDIQNYWAGSSGRHLLANNKRCISNGIEVERIFIEEERKVDLLPPVFGANHEIGVKVWSVKMEDLEPVLVRDFGIVDDGQLAVELFLESRFPSRAVFYSAATDEGRAKIAELENVWKRLISVSTKIPKTQ